MGLGAAMAGGNPGQGRQSDDFYPTPANVTEALLRVETFPGSVLEPACGDGAMLRVLEAHGYRVVGLDINPRFPGGRQGDFLALRGRLPVGSSIVTNPPFARAADFIIHAHAMGFAKLALLLKSTYWHAASRQDLFDRFRPARIYPLTWRPDFLGKGAPTMEVA